MSETIFTVKDGRGSKGQRMLYDWLNQLYPKSEVIYEQLIDDLNLRIDLYLPEQYLAVEYSGRQHYEYIPHFHKSYEDFEQGKLYDQKKLDYLLEHGITLIEVPYNHNLKSKEDLLTLINNTTKSPYPFKPFIKEEFKLEIKEEVKQSIKDVYKKRKEELYKSKEYLDKKESIKKEAKVKRQEYKKSDSYKEQLEKQKELRKKYQELKRNKK